MALIFPASRAAGEFSHTIKFGTMAPSQSAWTELPLQLLIPLVHDMYGEQIRLSVYYGGTMGDDNDIIRKIRLGQLHGCCCTNQGTIKAVPELSVLTLPLLFHSYAEVDHVLGRLRPKIETLFDKRGYYLLFIVDTGFLHFFCEENPETLEAIRKQRVFSWFGEIQLETFTQLGIHPIPVSITELPSSISSGITNAGVGPTSWLLATQMYSYVNYVLDPPFFYGPSTGFIEKKQVDEIRTLLEKRPDEFQRLQRLFTEFTENLQAESYLDSLGIKDEKFREAGKEVIGWLTQQKLTRPEDAHTILIGVFRRAEKAWISTIRGFEQECFEGFYRRGMKKVPLREEDRAQFQKAAEAVWEKFSGSLYPEWLLKNILAILAEYRQSSSE